MKAKFVYETLEEAYEPKDLKRVQDFRTKSGGDYQKEIRLAQQMANTLTNVEKAIGRAEAALEVYGEWNEIVNIFFNKAKQLGYTGTPPGERTVLGSKLPKHLQYKNPRREQDYRRGGVAGRGRHFYGNPILPLGKVDLRTGGSPSFNVYDTWMSEENEGGTVEVWRDNKGVDTSHLEPQEKEEETTLSSILKPKSKEEVEKQKRKYFNYRIIFTSDDSPMHEIGEFQHFYHDQSGSTFGKWEMVDYVPLKYMKELILPYGKKISGYVYK